MTLRGSSHLTPSTISHLDYCLCWGNSSWCVSGGGWLSPSSQASACDVPLMVWIRQDQKIQSSCPTYLPTVSPPLTHTQSILTHPPTLNKTGRSCLLSLAYSIHLVLPHVITERQLTIKAGSIHGAVCDTDSCKEITDVHMHILLVYNVEEIHFTSFLANFCLHFLHSFSQVTYTDRVCFSFLLGSKQFDDCILLGLVNVLALPPHIKKDSWRTQVFLSHCLSSTLSFNSNGSVTLE